jgi:ketosteroid isomerase-like protein
VSQENVECVRASWEAWKRGDTVALFAFYDPAIEWDMTRSLVADMGVYHGHAGVRELFREWRAFFADYYAEPEEFIDAGECVVVRARHGGRGRGGTVSGFEMPAYYSEMPSFWQVYRLRSGRAVRVEVYRNEADALEAVGL